MRWGPEAGSIDYIRAQQDVELIGDMMQAWGVVLDRSRLVVTAQTQEEARALRDLTEKKLRAMHRPIGSLTVELISAWITK